MKLLLRACLASALIVNAVAVPLGDLGAGVTAKESAAGQGYILFSPSGLSTRFTLWNGQASHFAAVYYASDSWYYYNNETPVAFTPIPSDVLVASVDYSADTATLLSGHDAFTHRIRTGYASGDMGIIVNQFNGVGNPGEFTMTGTNIKLNTPQWWAVRGMINANAPNNLSVANLGQLKNMAYNAHAELLETHLPGGAGFALDSLFPAPPVNPEEAWYEAQKAPLNLGQLKAVAKPFYDRLNSVSPLWIERQFHTNGLSTLGAEYFKDNSTDYFYPWNPATPVGDNLKLATIGQLKAVFALRFKESMDGDVLPDIWEHHIINASDSDAITGLEHVTSEGDFDNDGVDNLTEFQINTDPILYSNAAIQWVSLRNVSLDSSIPATPALTKTGGGSYWNAGARSSGVLDGDGAIFASSSDGDSYTMFGLCDIQLNHGYRQINYAIYFSAGQTIYVYENGISKGLKTSYLSTDIIGIRRTGATVEYLKNGIVFYTSNTPSTRPVYVLASLNRNDSMLSNTTSTGFTSTLDIDEDGLLDSYELQIAAADPNDAIHGIADVTGFGDFDQDSLSDAAEYDLQSDPINTPNQGWIPVTWSNFTQTASSAPSGQFGSTLVKTFESNGYNADASSADAMVGDGGVSCRVSSPSSRCFIGLNLSDDTASYTDLTYSIYFESTGAFYVYENGSKKGQKGYYGLNDVFSIEREGDTVEYKRNGKVFYTSTFKSSQPLIIDSSLYYKWSSLTHCLKRGFPYNGDLDGDGLDYNDEYALISQLPPTIAATIDDISATSDLDGDGVADLVEIANGDDALDIYSGGGNVAWPSDALVAWYRMDQNPPETDSSGNVTQWKNSLAPNDTDGMHIRPGSPTNIPKLVQGSSLPVMHSEENDLSYVKSNGSDYLSSETNGFTILGHFKPTADSTNVYGGLLNNEQYTQTGFRLARLKNSSGRLSWWSSQSGGDLSIQSKEGLALNSPYQFTLSHHPDTAKPTSLHINGEYQSSRMDAVIRTNTRHMYLQYIGGHKGQPADWSELILAGRQLTTGEQTLLQDYLLAKHQSAGPLAGDADNDGIPDWREVELWGSAAIHSRDINNNGLADSLEIDMLGYWKLDESAGSTVITDSSGNSLDGDLLAETRIPDGISGGAVSLTSTQQMKITPAAGQLNVGDNGSDFSVSFWIRLHANHEPGYNALLKKGDTGTQRTFAIYLNPDGKTLHARVTTDVNTNVGIDSSVTELLPLQWTHVSYVHGNGQLKLYIGGMLDSVVSVGISIANDDPFYIGKSADWRGVNADFDEIMIHRRILSDAEIKALANVDTDGDGLSDAREMIIGSNIYNRDTDGDKMEDGYEDYYSMKVNDPGVESYLLGASGDMDFDGKSNLEEFQAGSIPNSYWEEPEFYISPPNYGFRWFGVEGIFYILEYSYDLATWNSSDLYYLGSNSELNIPIDFLPPGTSSAFFRLAYQSGDGDFDGDGYSNIIEIQDFETNPVGVTNTDGDSLPDEWEMYHHGDLSLSDNSNTDGDWLTALDEYQLGLSPVIDDDVDNDGWLDFEAAKILNMNLSDQYTSPEDIFPWADEDGDGISNASEVAAGTDPLDAADPVTLVYTALVDLDASDLVDLDDPNWVAGPVVSWSNNGSLGGLFYADSQSPMATTQAGVPCVQFAAGAEDWLRGPLQPVQLTGAGSRTVVAWVYNPDVSVSQSDILVSWGGVAAGSAERSLFSVRLGSNNGNGAFKLSGSGEGDLAWSNGVTPVQGQWSFVVFRYNLASRSLMAIQDFQAGVSKVPFDLKTAVYSSDGSPQHFVLGGDNDSTGTPSSLTTSLCIGRLYVYDRALPMAEILNLYNNDRIKYSKNAVSDTDGDGVPDLLEASFGTDINLADSDGDGLSDLAEINGGTDPNDFFNGRAHYVRVVSGDLQFVTQGEEVNNALVFEVLDASGEKISGAPVTVTVPTSGGEVREDSAGTALTTNLQLSADANGEVKVRFKSNE